jgi:pimeloyl-ACP methyl ester carboxylesterase
MPGYRWHPVARLCRAPVLGEAFARAAHPAAFRFALTRREPRGLPRAFVDGMYRHYDRGTRRAMVALYRSLPDPGQGAELAAGLLRHALDVTVLVIWGERDPYLPSHYAARQRDAFPHADVHVIEGSGHWPHIDNPAVVEPLVAGFLA